MNITVLLSSTWRFPRRLQSYPNEQLERAMSRGARDQNVPYYNDKVLLGKSVSSVVIGFE